MDPVAKSSRQSHRLGDHGARKLDSARKAWLSNRPQSSSFPSGLSESQAIDVPSSYCKCTLQHARTLRNTPRMFIRVFSCEHERYKNYASIGKLDFACLLDCTLAFFPPRHIRPRVCIQYADSQSHQLCHTLSDVNCKGLIVD